MAAEELVVLSLWGGAALAGAPARFADLSPFREVPDHQEIFADIGTDQSIIFELTDLHPVPDDEFGVVHFKELLKENEATAPSDHQILKSTVLGAQDLPWFKDLWLSEKIVATLVYGRMRVAKFRQVVKNEVSLLLCCIRLKHVNTDLLISLNFPTKIHAESSAAEKGSVASSEDPTPLFRQIVKSFRFVDWGLFPEAQATKVADDD